MFTTRTTRAAACVTAAVALAGTLAAGQASATGDRPAANRVDQRLINKSDGSRLALLNDSTADGATAISLRDPGWNFQTVAWEEVDGRWEGGSYSLTFRNKAANKCLQPATGSPVRGTTVVVRTCDGSALQRWVLRPEYGTDSRWWLWEPKVNTNLAIAPNRYHDGSWDSLYLDTAYPSDDRLWRLNTGDNAW